MQSEQTFKAKAQELINIIQKQDEELKKARAKIDEESERANMIARQNEAINKKLEDNNNDIEEYKEINTENEKIILSFNNQLKEEKQKVSKLSIDCEQLSKENSSLKEKLNNVLSDIKDKTELVDELSAHKTDLLNKINDMQLGSKDRVENIKNSIDYFCTLVRTSIKWGNTYIGNNHNNNISSENIVPLPNNCELSNQEEECIQKLSDLYINLNVILTEIYKKINYDYERYDKTLGDMENDKVKLQSENETLKKKYYDLAENLKQFEDDSANIKNEVEEKSTLLETLKSKLSTLSQINDAYEIQISNLLEKLLKINNTNSDKFNSNEIYKNIFKNLHLINPSMSTDAKFEKIEEISLNFADLSLCLINELQKMHYNIEQYETLNIECSQLKKEILDLKKGYSNKKTEILYEKEKILSEVEKNKIEEFNKIKFDYDDKLSQLERDNKEKDEEIEKLHHDNNLLYSQYLLSEQNFNEYKANRKDYE